jgi:choline kinase
MRVIILAGGKGVRLAPLTEVIPKPLVPLGGMHIMELKKNQNFLYKDLIKGENCYIVL